MDLEGLQELKSLSIAELDKVDHDILKWGCCIVGCTRFTRIRDYGVAPIYFWRKKWLNLDLYCYYCAHHWKQFKNNGFPPDSNIIYKPRPHLIT